MLGLRHCWSVWIDCHGHDEEHEEVMLPRPHKPYPKHSNLKGRHFSAFSHSFKETEGKVGLATCI